jgi:hypothetical protein
MGIGISSRYTTSPCVRNMNMFIAHFSKVELRQSIAREKISMDGAYQKVQH